MSKEIYISSTPHETRLAIVENDELTEIYYERENEYTLAGSIYNGKVTRVLPGMQSSFVDVGLERDAFLYITDFMEEAGDSADFEHSGEAQRAPRTLEGQRSEVSRGEGQRNEGQRGGRDRNGEGRERNDGRERNEGREQPYISERSREQAVATPATDTAVASEGRDEEFGNRNNRNDRGGRSRGRGRRDRNGSGERAGGAAPTGAEARPGGEPESEQLRESERFTGTAGFPGAGASESSFEAEVISAMPVGEPGTAGAELGEGAPGADGSRRWRGRRGRRRGRSTGQREGVSQAGGGETDPDAAVDTVPGTELEEVMEAPASEVGGDAGSMVEPASTGSASQPTQQLSTASERLQRGGQDRGSRSGQDRGSRSERGDRNERGDRDERSGRNAPARVPRGFAPRTSLYGVDSTSEPEQVLPAIQAGEAPTGAPPEPLILPGESLGKYRKGGDTAPAGTTSSFATPIALPDSGFKVDPNWDGSATLPGETLSRYRGASASASAQGSRPSERPDFRRSAGRGEGQRDGQRDAQRDGRGERPENGRGQRDGREQRFGGRPERGLTPERNPEVTTVPDAVPAPDLQSHGPVSGYAHLDVDHAEIQAHLPDFSHSGMPEPTAEAPQHEDASHASRAGFEPQEKIGQINAAQTPSAAEDIKPEAGSEAQGEHDYEPTEASASYRVDPAAPSEYRQSAAPVVESEIAEPEAEQPFALNLTHAPESFFAESTPKEIEEALETPVESHAEPVDSVAPPNLAHTEQQTDAPHDITTIENGAMFSAAPHTPAEPTYEQAEVPVAGVEAYDDGDLAELHAEGNVLDVEASSSPETAGFAPGAGDLEEDFIEEEELEGTSLHAHAYEEYDDLEEEQVEGAPDLGMMIRDMSLDHITHTSAAIEEEDDEDFEEDTLEENLDDVDRGDNSGEPALERYEGDREFEPETKSFAGTEPEAANGVSGTENGQVGGYNSGSESQRRGRRDNGRRGGRGDRSRGGNREVSDMPQVPDRTLDRPYATEQSSSSDRNDHGGNERGGNERSGNERGGNERASHDRYGSDRYGSGGIGERARNTGGSGDRDRGRSGGNGRGGRQSMQSTNLPAISELLKPGQEILCQIAKEPIAKKGARITSHIALPGRFLVFMPTVSHIGVSRKIESDGERRRLKEILLSEKGEAAGGFIVRTAAAGASEEELRSDLRFLLNLWADIKQRSESSKSPALIYHDLNLVERILRDQVTDSFSAIWVDTETEYERVLRFLQRFQPGLIRRVKLYTKETPLFEQFGITEEINKALRSKVWLKSGGSIVINQTEALVAIDINTGKFVGKTARLEDTIVKTNLDAIPEIVRQIRLRDLGGIIIIDFIDMDDRRNRNRVMAALEDELKTDRAPSKVLPFNDFGLVAITRKRVKQSLERTLSTTCNVCTGTGMVKSPITVCNDIYIEMRKMHKHLDRGDVMLRVHPEVVKQLKQTGSRWLQEMEEICGKTILIKSDPSLHPEQFDIH